MHSIRPLRAVYFIPACIASGLFLGTLLSTAGCESGPKESSFHHGQVEMPACCPLMSVTSAIATIHPTAGNTANGWVRFETVENGVRVTAEIMGLPPNTSHGFHIHEFGDCSRDDGTSAGGHYNPAGHQHGLPGTTSRHAGDMGNLTADANGVAHYEAVFSGFTIVGSDAPVLGRAVIIHAGRDDGGQPVGNAGARIGHGVIGISSSD